LPDRLSSDPSPGRKMPEDPLFTTLQPDLGIAAQDELLDESAR
jgi:hypothetical protein